MPTLYQTQLAQPPKVNTYDAEEFYATLVFGSGALASFRGRGLTITRVTNGQYKVAFTREYRRRCYFRHGWGKCAAGAVFFPVILTDNSALVTDPHVIVETRTEAGVATDPASGDELDVSFGLSNNVLNA